MSLRDGGPAYPAKVRVHTKEAPDDGSFYLGDGIWEYAVPGMTLRDWFAGQALAGLVPIIGAPEDGPDSLWDASIAMRAYALADAMLAARAIEAAK